MRLIWITIILLFVNSQYSYSQTYQEPEKGKKTATIIGDKHKSTTGFGVFDTHPTEFYRIKYIDGAIPEKSGSDFVWVVDKEINIESGTRDIVILSSSASYKGGFRTKLNVIAGHSYMATGKDEYSGQAISADHIKSAEIWIVDLTSGKIVTSKGYTTVQSAVDGIVYPLKK